MAETNKATLRYTDDADRSFGAAGMAIGLVILDGESIITGISLDNADADILELSADWDTPQPHRALTVKESWSMDVRKFQLATAMALGNVMCRRMVARGDQMLDRDTRSLLHALAMEEGEEECSLDDDEVEQLFNKEVTLLQQVFRHTMVQHVARDFALDIHSRRRLTRHDILSHLRAIARL